MVRCILPQAMLTKKPVSPWWIDEGLALRNGVFQGGGAKGLAYVGALKAFRCRGMWFGAVAGSSAGAITATMIAAGFKPTEMEDLTRSALDSIRRPKLRRAPLAWAGLWAGHLSGVLGLSFPIFPTERLREWLEDRLRKRYQLFTGREWTDDRPELLPHYDVTFSALQRATGIDLFIVALDTTDGVPIVLSPYSAPDCQVSWAAVASSSLPLLMSPQRLLLTRTSTWETVNVVDGGAWANYPRFVFSDASFAAYHKIPKAARKRETVGFILKSSAPEPMRIGRFGHLPPNVLGLIDEPAQGGMFEADLRRAVRGGNASSSFSERHQASRRRKLVDKGVTAASLLIAMALLVAAIGEGWWVAAAGVGALLPAVFMQRSRLLRALIGLARYGLVQPALRVAGIALMTTLLIAGLLTVPRWTQGFLNYFQVLGATALGYGLLAILSTMTGALIALLVWSFFNAFLVEDAPPIANAVLGAATRVPAWVGADPSEFVIRVPVDPAIDTTSFTVPDEIAHRAIKSAYDSTLRQLRERAQGHSPVVQDAAKVQRWPTDTELAQWATQTNEPGESKWKDVLIPARTLVAMLGWLLFPFAGLAYAMHRTTGRLVATLVGASLVIVWMILRAVLRDYAPQGGAFTGGSPFKVVPPPAESHAEDAPPS
jgi:predicted acylesterase/phospholipase RssA